MKNATSLTFESLLEDFENKIAFIISLIYQKKFDEIIAAVSEILTLSDNLIEHIPLLKDADWLETIINESRFYLTSLPNETKINRLHDNYFYNIKHIARYRREGKAVNNNSRILIEDLFSTAVKISLVEQHFSSLTRLTLDLARGFENDNKRMANHFRRINKFSAECECLSLLSITVSWEIICCLILEIEGLMNLTKTKLRKIFVELEETILTIESSICGILETISIDLQVNFGLKKANLNYTKHFNTQTIFI